MHAYDKSRLDAPIHGFGLTISVGIYELVPTKNGERLKKGKTKVRVRGDFFDRKAIAAKADEVVAALDAGTYTGEALVDIRGKA